MQHHRRDGSSLNSSMVQRRFQKDLSLNMGSESYYRSDKNRSFIRYGVTLIRSGRVLPTFLITTLVILFVFTISDAPPFQSMKNSFCNFTIATNQQIRNRVLLDRFAASASRRLRRKEWQQLNTLVLVAGHAIFLGKQWTSEELHNEKKWILESFQKGQVDTFLKHIQKGVELTANDTTALLLFSGGQTREGAGPRSEGLTYWMAADSQDWFGYKNSGVENRSLAEEYARDSFENLLFSICRFHQVVGEYPRVIKVVGFGFKRIRFVDIHRKALRFPFHRFQYHGIDPDGTDGMRGLSAGERAQAMGPFANDPYGCNTVVLSGKRESRDPYLRYHPYPQGCPELSELFKHCGRSLFSGPLPWDDVSTSKKKVN